jgi:uncharacterized protein YihD (DUF1040 family)
LRDLERIDKILELLREVWTKVPDWRLTQLVVNASDTDHDCGPVFYMEDEEFEQRLLRLAEGLDNLVVQQGKSD